MCRILDAKKVFCKSCFVGKKEQEFFLALSHLKYTWSCEVLHIAVAINVERSHPFICRTRCSKFSACTEGPNYVARAVRSVLGWRQLQQFSGGLGAGYDGCGSIPWLLMAITTLIHIGNRLFSKPQIKVVISGAQKQKSSPFFWAFTWKFSLINASAMQPWINATLTGRSQNKWKPDLAPRKR